MSKDDAKLSVNDGHSRGDDSGEYRSRSVSNVGRCVSYAAAIVAMSNAESAQGSADSNCWTKQAMSVCFLDECQRERSTMTM